MPKQKKNTAGLLPGTGRGEWIFPQNYTVVDVETTGLHPEWDRVIEIGALKIKNGKPGEQFSSLLRPPFQQWGKYVTPTITDLTGITNEMLEKAPEAAKVLQQFEKFLGPDPVVGYNVEFDMAFLEEHFQKLLGRPLPNNWVDVLPMVQFLFPHWEHHRLADAVAHYHLTNERAHRAFSDVEATWQVFAKVQQDALRVYPDAEKFFTALKRGLHLAPEEEQLSLW